MNERWRVSLDEAQIRQLGVLWGKSDAGGSVNLLVQHLFDAFAVGELLWDEYLPPKVRWRLDEVAGGRGRDLFRWLCGLHDVGKASPAFQLQQRDLAQRVAATGLTFPPLRRSASQDWRHDRAGGLAIRDLLDRSWGPGGHSEWVWPLIAGHHGVFPTSGDVGLDLLKDRHAMKLHGTGAWADVRAVIIDVVTEVAGYRDLAEVRPVVRPSRADQIALAGFIVMADWIASDEERFWGIDDLGSVGIEAARGRATRAWADLGLRCGWGELQVPDDPLSRFGRPPRASQSMVVAAARSMGAPGLVVVEAPMGEGKTEAALAASEVLAARFGCDGVEVAMPTMATSDPMLTRVRPWLESIAPGLPVALLHGRTLFNGEWQAMRRRRTRSSPNTSATDEYGMVDDLVPSSSFPYSGVGVDTCDDGLATAVAEWLLGRGRGLLAPVVISTIDQALYAATRTRHVAVRCAGLAGKVVIIDEVHAADEFMTEFLVELLLWLGNGAVPVVLLSATLAPAQRERLMGAYLEGAGSSAEAIQAATCSGALTGYPAVTTAAVVGGEVERRTHLAEAWRPDLPVSVTVVDEPEDAPEEALGDLLWRLVGEGGVALVVRNTVTRAQDAFRAIEARFGPDAVLLHSRFSADDRACITEGLLDELGPTPTDRRPHRRVVVATQIAEQSFDIDADVLVTDIAPVDLLLQRVGRVHRHDQGEARPSTLRQPAMWITGVRDHDGDRPWFPSGSEKVYGRHRLLRSLGLARRADGTGWAVPSVVPGLVAAAYDGRPVPPEWEADEAAAAATWDLDREEARAHARANRLSSDGNRMATDLAGLHLGAVRPRDVERWVNVRDGDMGAEVVLVRYDGGRHTTLGSEDLGVNGEHGRDEPVKVLGGTVRLPAWDDLTVAADQKPTLPEWADDPWLGRAHVVVLKENSAQLGKNWALSYDPREGLHLERTS